jgi:hypothetical protein
LASGFSAAPLFISPRKYLPHDILRLTTSAPCRREATRERSPCPDGYGFAKLKGKPTFAILENDSEISGVVNGLAVCAASRLHVVQCDT